MTPTHQGSFHLFRFAGIDLYLHWSWFIVAAYEISGRNDRYSSLSWNVLEYVSLFVIVLLHEFGHSLACRQVGGEANQIVLWPLGGVAYVSPPQRPGATLWSIVAGPLVNVLIIPVLLLLEILLRSLGGDGGMPNTHAFLQALWFMNILLLIFNLLPIYPLDGGQIVRSLLWFVLGRARSLMVASLIGFLGVAGLLLVAWQMKAVWLGIMSAFIVLNCWGGLVQANALARIARMPRREGYACPTCRASPPLGAYWRCGQCQRPFDIFATEAVCPHCGAQYAIARCLDCGAGYPIHEWSHSITLPPDA